MKNVSRRRWIYALLCVAMMGVIFYFSAMTALESSKVSGRVTKVAVQLTYPEYTALPKPQQTGVYQLMQHLVRKSAHFGEYALLGALITLFLSTFSLRFRGLIALAACVLYAIGDEVHQGFVAGRGPLAADVLIDSAGAAAGILLAALVLYWFTHHRPGLKE